MIQNWKLTCNSSEHFAQIGFSKKKNKTNGTEIKREKKSICNDDCAISDSIKLNEAHTYSYIP